DGVLGGVLARRVGRGLGKVVDRLLHSADIERGASASIVEAPQSDVVVRRWWRLAGARASPLGRRGIRTRLLIEDRGDVVDGRRGCDERAAADGGRDALCLLDGHRWHRGL